MSKELYYIDRMFFCEMPQHTFDKKITFLCYVYMALLEGREVPIRYGNIRDCTDNFKLNWLIYVTHAQPDYIWIRTGPIFTILIWTVPPVQTPVSWCNYVDAVWLQAASWLNLQLLKRQHCVYLYILPWTGFITYLYIVTIINRLYNLPVHTAMNR